MDTCMHACICLPACRHNLLVTTTTVLGSMCPRSRFDSNISASLLPMCSGAAGHCPLSSTSPEIWCWWALFFTSIVPAWCFSLSYGLCQRIWCCVLALNRNRACLAPACPRKWKPSISFTMVMASSNPPGLAPAKLCSPIELQSSWIQHFFFLAPSSSAFVYPIQQL
jgi:hypothetical protein